MQEKISRRGIWLRTKTMVENEDLDWKGGSDEKWDDLDFSNEKSLITDCKKDFRQRHDLDWTNGFD